MNRFLMHLPRSSLHLRDPPSLQPLSLEELLKKKKALEEEAAKVSGKGNVRGGEA